MKEVQSVRCLMDPSSGSYRKNRAQAAVEDPPARQRGSLPLSPALRIQQARELRTRLSPMLTGQITLTITDNRSVMVSIQRDPRHSRYTIRLHHLFVEAPQEVLQDLAQYVAFNNKTASKRLNDFVEQNNHRIRPTPPDAKHHRINRTQGRVYNLKQLQDELNATYFQGEATCDITWGRHAQRGKSRRSIKVGSFSYEENLVRIHPGLDQAWIPLFYIQWVIFHEMLHAITPAPVINGRHQFHTTSFAREECRFEHYDLATAWEKRNLAALLCI